LLKTLYIDYYISIIVISIMGLRKYVYAWARGVNGNARVNKKSIARENETERLRSTAVDNL